MGYNKEIKELVKERLIRIPSNISFSIGSFGDFTRDELIDEVEKETKIGDAIVDMQLEFIRKMPKIIAEHRRN